MFIRSFLFRHGPTPGALFDWFGFAGLGPLTRVFTRAYMFWWETSRKRLTAWHRQELKRIDSNFAYAEATRELINAREVARERGVKPLSSKYPDIRDFLPKDYFSSKL